MSVRIYQLSKEIGMENAELIALLKDRGYEVKSASSTVDNISADSLREEYAPKGDGEANKTEEAVEVKAEPKAPAIPSGAIVRSKEDIERERREREEAEEEEQRKRAESQQVNKPSPPPVKAPPALPKVPMITSRPGNVTSRPQAPAPSSQFAQHSGPSAPVLRTDLPKPPPAPEAKPEEARGNQPPNLPKPPMGKSPTALRPPVVRGPSPISPPKINMPKAPVADTSAGEGNEKGEGSEGVEGESAPEKALNVLQVKTPIVVRDFAVQIGKKPFQLISELMELGIFASMNSAIDENIAERIALNHGIKLEVRHRGEGAQAAEEQKVEKKKAAERQVQLEPRAPIVVILGHVDHGKTTLLDTIRKANVVSGEAGGITQHVAAYQVEQNGRKITFIDTPGHAAFSNMRARGANVTDIAVLVVAADDGFMPQTDEALKHARNAKVPVVVAINKMDAPGVNLDKVYRQMQERELAPEEWGGETLSAKISALKGDNIEGLLDSILLQAEVTDGIEADPKGNPEGVIIEAQKELGRGSTASVIVLQGTLKPGMAIVCGENYCRIRQLIDDKGNAVKEALPSTPVKIVGWSSPPDSGDNFYTVKNEREAKKIAEENELKRKQLEASQKQEGKASIDDLFAAIAKTSKKTYRVLVKADVYGTAEALATTLLSIKSDKINIEVVDMGVGDITRNDVLMASASGAEVIGFNIGVENGVASFAKHHEIKIIQHNIIYELVTKAKDAMADLLEPELRENKIGAAEVRQVFPLGKSLVAGCMVTEGRIQRGAIARLSRKGSVAEESKIGALKRFKDDASEVRAGYECGIQLEGVGVYEEGDIIEVFEILKIKPSL